MLIHWLNSSSEIWKLSSFRFWIMSMKLAVSVEKNVTPEISMIEPKISEMFATLPGPHGEKSPYPTVASVVRAK